MKKIEILFPEVANLYGELGTINYLKQAFKNESLILTSFDERPKFANEEVDMIYIGPMSEKWQVPVISKLLRYKDRLKGLIEADTPIIAINTGFEIFGSHILERGKEIKALGMFDFYTEHDFSRRYNQKMLLELGTDTVVGTKSQFSRVFNIGEEKAWMRVIKGGGNNPQSSLDGLSYKNFRGTHLLGPALLCNPSLTKLLYSMLRIESEPLYQEIIAENYRERLTYYNS